MMAQELTKTRKSRDKEAHRDMQKQFQNMHQQASQAILNAQQASQAILQAQQQATQVAQQVPYKTDDLMNMS